MTKTDFKNLINECNIEVAREEKQALKKSLKLAVKNLIAESIEELKYAEEEGLAEIIEALDKDVKSKYKNATVMFDDSKNITIDCGIPHFFRIVPQSMDVFDVLYLKGRTDRTKKLNLNTEEMKKFVNDTLKSKELTYVKKEFNKVAINNKDNVEKSDNPRNDILTKKEVKDAKNDNKNYIEQQVTNEDDLPTKPMKVVDKIKRQKEGSLKGTKPDYTYPKQKDKKITIVRKKTTKFKR